MSEQISQNIRKSSSLQSCRVIFDITFGRTVRSRKTAFILIVAFLPVLLAVCYRILGRDVRPEQPFSRVLTMSPVQALSLMIPFFLQFLSVLVALFYGTALLADEIDSRTIIHLFTRPVRKHSIILGKFAAYILEAFIILIPPMVLTFLIIATHSGMSRSFADSLSIFGKQLGVTVLALMVYGAIFTFFGARLKRPVLFGLLFAFGWEKMAMAVPGVVRKFSVIHYLMSVFPGGTTARGFTTGRGFLKLSEVAGPSGTVFSIVMLLAITIIFFGLSVFTIYQKEYRFE